MSTDPAQTRTAEQLRAEAQYMIRAGYSLEVAAAILRLDVDAVRRLVGAESLGGD